VECRFRWTENLFQGCRRPAPDAENILGSEEFGWIPQPEWVPVPGAHLADRVRGGPLAGHDLCDRKTEDRLLPRNTDRARASHPRMVSRGDSRPQRRARLRETGLLEEDHRPPDCDVPWSRDPDLEEGRVSKRAGKSGLLAPHCGIALCTRKTSGPWHAVQGPVETSYLALLETARKAGGAFR